jgi:phosphatidylcholine synthase
VRGRQARLRPRHVGVEKVHQRRDGGRVDGAARLVVQHAHEEDDLRRAAGEGIEPARDGVALGLALLGRAGHGAPSKNGEGFSPVVRAGARCASPLHHRCAMVPSIRWRYRPRNNGGGSEPNRSVYGLFRHSRRRARWRAKLIRPKKGCTAMDMPAPRDRIPVSVAWAIHALTASGAVLAFLALLAVEQGRWRLALLWLGAALIVDGIDGPLARWAGVTRRTPGIDGATLDLVVDYLTYVFVPALLIYRAGLLPAAVAPAGVAAILLSSLYTFARTDMKTADNFFRGFPALWNVVAFYLFALRPGAMAGAIVVAVFCALTFAPITFVHPVRVRGYRPWLGIATALWGLGSLALLWPDWSAPWREAWLALSLAGAGVLLAIGLLRTLRGAEAGAQESK